MKKHILIITLLLTSLTIAAQILEPIHWQSTATPTPDGNTTITFTAQIDQGWHLYDTQLPAGGPLPTLFTYEGATPLDSITPSTTPHKALDPQFGIELAWYQNQVTFTQTVTPSDSAPLIAHVRFMACNHESCLPPTTIDFTYDASASSPSTPATTSTLTDNTLWTPVIDQLHSYDENASTASSSDSLWWIFLKGLLGGLIALLTPCVWPIIPMTVSFFIKRNKTRRKGIKEAILYGFSIIIIYLSLGIIVTLIFGASALNSLSTNAIFNLFFFLLLILFAASFFGAFELTLPSSWSTRLDAKSENTSGILSILLMAFTLVVVSFSCTGPIIGTLLVDVSLNGNLFAPIIGMTGFAIALALPFSLFALFPSWLKSLPKSGDWLNSVKVILGFLELAFALKFLSVADLAYGWHILDRETFIVLWIVIFGMMGFYLLGKIRFPHEKAIEHVSVLRLFLAMLSIAFAIYMLPGLWGAPLKSISAFAPPISTQDFNLNRTTEPTIFNDYEQGMTYAQQHNKPVLIDFSGYGCVNCRKMEAAVWTAPQVNTLMTEELVLITLYVDDKRALHSPITVEENGKQIQLKTIGDKNSYLQRHKFGANAQPFYVLLDPNGLPLQNAYSFSEDIEAFVKYLKIGINNYTHR